MWLQRKRKFSIGIGWYSWQTTMTDINMKNTIMENMQDMTRIKLESQDNNSWKETESQQGNQESGKSNMWSSSNIRIRKIIRKWKI